ncbi:MAG: oligosaccharide flippase family protein [Opitutales bacterium]
MAKTIVQRIFSGGLFLLMGQLLQRGFMLIFVVVFSQLLPLAAFGQVMLAVTLMSLGAVLSVVGLPTAVQKFCAGEPTPERRHNFALIALLATGLVSLFGVVVANNIEGLSALFSDTRAFGKILALASFGVVAQGLFNLFFQSLQARERGQDYVTMGNVAGVLKLALPLSAYLFTDDPATIIGGLGLAYAFSALGCLHILRGDDFRPALHGTSLTPAPRVMLFAGSASLVGFSYLLAQHADKLMLGALSTDETVGIYSTAAVLALSLGLFHTAFVGIFMPVASDSHERGDHAELARGYLLVSRWATAISGSALLVLVAAGSWILSLFGPQFGTEDAFRALLILGAFYFSASFFGPTAAVLQMCGSARWESFNAIVFLGFNLALNFWLIPVLGVVGAAFATLLAGLTRRALQWGQLWSRHRLVVIPLHYTIPFTAVAAGVGFAVAEPAASVTRLVLASAGLAVMAGWVLFTLHDRERALLQKARARLPGADKPADQRPDEVPSLNLPAST